MAATVFWFFNSLNKTYTTNISFPLEFDYDEKYYIPVEPLPEELRINVTGTGWDLFRRSVGFRVQPLIIPLERPSGVRKIVGSTLPALFSGQLEAMQINLVVNDTVYLDIQPKVRRWLKVSVDAVEKLIRNEYGIVGPVKIEPDSIFIEGPISVINQLKEPFPLNLDEFDIDENFDENIEVKLSQGHLILRNPPTVRVSFRVEKFVEVTDTIALEIINIPRGAQPKMEVKKLKATLRMQQSLMNAFSWDSVRAVVDLREFKRGAIKVQPQLTGLPVEITVVNVDTVQITY